MESVRDIQKTSYLRNGVPESCGVVVGTLVLATGENLVLRKPYYPDKCKPQTYTVPQEEVQSELNDQRESKGFLCLSRLLSFKRKREVERSFRVESDKSSVIRIQWVDDYLSNLEKDGAFQDWLADLEPKPKHLYLVTQTEYYENARIQHTTGRKSWFKLKFTVPIQDAITHGTTSALPSGLSDVANVKGGFNTKGTHNTTTNARIPGINLFILGHLEVDIQGRQKPWKLSVETVRGGEGEGDDADVVDFEVPFFNTLPTDGNVDREQWHSVERQQWRNIEHQLEKWIKECEAETTAD